MLGDCARWASTCRRRRAPRRHRHPGRPKRIQIVTLRRPPPPNNSPTPSSGPQRITAKPGFAQAPGPQRRVPQPLCRPSRPPRLTRYLRMAAASSFPCRSAMTPAARHSREDFYRALLRIWLGDKPVDAKPEKRPARKGQAPCPTVPQAPNSTWPRLFNPTTPPIGRPSCFGFSGDVASHSAQSASSATIN